MPNNRAVLLVSGMVAADPYQGGATWAVLQYLLGFRQLGYDVFFVEPIAAAKLRVRPSLAGASGSALDKSANAAYFRKVTRTFGLTGRAALLLAGTRETVGLPYDELRAAARRAVALVNLSGLLTDPELARPAPVRVYLDLDPAFTQLWQAQGVDMRFDGHTHFATVGLSLGRADCPVPDCGRDWLPTRPPVVLERWPAGGAVVHDALTTVGHWRSYGSVRWNGLCLGQKAHSLRRFIALPKRTDERLRPALAVDPGETDDLVALAAHGWRLTDPARVARTPAAYRRFVRGSRAELGVAKSGYADARCGWFSDRSACYLAAGRPVLAQETGWSDHLPAGEGLLSFTTEDELVDGVEELRRDYGRHARAARRLAEEWFDSDRVLPDLLRRVGAC
jgi:hypothetical protein